MRVNVELNTLTKILGSFSDKLKCAPTSSYLRFNMPFSLSNLDSNSRIYNNNGSLVKSQEQYNNTHFLKIKSLKKWPILHRLNISFDLKIICFNELFFSMLFK